MYLPIGDSKSFDTSINGQNVSYMAIVEPEPRRANLKIKSLKCDPACSLPLRKLYCQWSFYIRFSYQYCPIVCVITLQEFIERFLHFCWHGLKQQGYHQQHTFCRHLGFTNTERFHGYLYATRRDVLRDASSACEKLLLIFFVSFSKICRKLNMHWYKKSGKPSITLVMFQFYFLRLPLSGKCCWIFRLFPITNFDELNYHVVIATMEPVRSKCCKLRWMSNLFASECKHS